MKYGNNTQSIQGSAAKMTFLDMPRKNNVAFALIGIS
jgi:hypothetical protein